MGPSLGRPILEWVYSWVGPSFESDPLVLMLAFLLGLAVGLSLLAWQKIRISQRLKQLLEYFGEENLPPYLSKTSKLFMAIAQQQRHQQELQAVLASVQQLINFAPFAYLQVDRDNHLLWCNQEASRLVEIDDPSPTTPRLLLEQVRSYDLDQLIEATRKQQQRQQRQWVIHPVKADPVNPVTRQSLYLMGYGVPLPDEQVGVFLENRQEVVQLAQQRDRWVSDVAHELKTPLTSIRLVTEMIETRVDPTLKPWVERLLGEVIHLSNLVHDLLDLSRLERRAAQSLNLRRLDFPSLIQKAWKSLEPITVRKKIRFTYLGPATLELEADQTRLYRVVLNLLDNAIKYSPEASTIQVRLTEQKSHTIGIPDSAHFEIIDTGPGFPETDIDQVFERFYRADPARTRLGGRPSGATPDASGSTPYTAHSCGLGLAIVRQIVEAHAGKVSAQNHPDTQGAWIQVTLPINPGKLLPSTALSA
ncbi:MAG: HAMP domain-containing histidine kinase [Synechococcales cyanobacterium CRU_2_2]|nr:HAMP domain-containing histidine kinase [Synechococcales cyanobacterium CRU_2_2]